jgi:FMN reductase
MRPESYSTLTLRLILDIVRKNGGDAKMLDLRKTQMPLYQSMDGNLEINDITNLVKWGEAYILATPDYHGSMSGTLKNFLDYYWSEFAGKVFGYICASHEKGLTVMDQMRTVVRQCYGWSMPYGVSVNSNDDFDSNNNITNYRLLNRLKIVGRDIVVYGNLLRHQFTTDIDMGVSDTFAAQYR